MFEGLDLVKPCTMFIRNLEHAKKERYQQLPEENEKKKNNNMWTFLFVVEVKQKFCLS